MLPTDLPSSNLSKGFSVAFVVLLTDGTDHFACRWLATHWQVAEAIAELSAAAKAGADDELQAQVEEWRVALEEELGVGERMQVKAKPTCNDLH